MKRKAVGVLLPGESWPDWIVYGQFARAYTASQVEFASVVSQRFDSFVVGPETSVTESAALERFVERGGRVIMFGAVSPAFERLAGIKRLAQETWNVLSREPMLRYAERGPFEAWLPWLERPLVRYDFEESWNVYGYGKIHTDTSRWAISGVYQADGAAVVASVDRIPFMTLRRLGTGAVLWVNRAVGLPDTVECSLLMRFLTSWEPRPGLPPYVSPIPPGYTAAATFRLDCDEAIMSSHAMVQDYFRAGFAPSLAVTTRELKTEELKRYIRDFQSFGGAIVSHSVDHPAHWGETRQAALYQAGESKRVLEEATGRGIRNAISPFHQNPIQAVEALVECGYTGLGTGTLDSAPEALLGWPGYYPGPKGMLPIALHEQKAMFHGDIVRRHGGLDHYKASFRAHRAAGVPFGSLDHPLSGYDYGWGSYENQRATHNEWIGWLKEQPKVWWANEDQMLDYIAGLQRMQLDREFVDGEHHIEIHVDGPLAIREQIAKMDVRFEGLKEKTPA